MDAEISEVVGSQTNKILVCDPYWFVILQLQIYPGETFTVSVVAVGQRNGRVPAAILSHMDRGKLFLSSQYIQRINKHVPHSTTLWVHSLGF